MDENAGKIFDYLPIRKETTENDYIDHLWQAFTSLSQSETTGRSFSIMPFHLLFMLAIQYMILRIANSFKIETDLFFSGVGGRDKDKLLSETRSVFDIALVNERTIMEVFQLTGPDGEFIKKSKELVNDRNDRLAHAKGGIEQNPDGKVSEYLTILSKMQKGIKRINKKIANEWLNEINAGDNLDEFIEFRLLKLKLCPLDLRDINLIILNDVEIEYEQWKQIADKGIVLTRNQTVEILLHLADSSDDFVRYGAISVLLENGEIDGEYRNELLRLERNDDIVKMLSQQ